MVNKPQRDIIRRLVTDPVQANPPIQRSVIALAYLYLTYGEKCLLWKSALVGQRVAALELINDSRIMPLYLTQPDKLDQVTKVKIESLVTHLSASA